MRAAIFVLLVPGTVAGWLPWYLATSDGPPSAAVPRLRVLGAPLVVLGWAVLLWGARAFVRQGRGTPSPHDPPRALVTGGLYGIVRNPMYVAVVLALLGFALWHWSGRLLAYAAVVALAFHLRVVLHEEPALARAFGAEYARYRARVPRWLPSWRRVLRRAAVALAAGGTALAPAALRAQSPVSVATPDSGVVSADLYGSGPRGVVLAPGGRFDKRSWAPQARALAGAGFRVVAIDFRGRGESRAGRAGGDGVHLDVLGAVRHLRASGAASVVVVGASAGGAAAADAVIAGAPGEVDGLVLLAHAPVDHPERLTGRKLFIVSRGDTTAAGVPRLVAIHRQYELAPPPKELVVLDGSAHAQFLFETDQGDRLLREILRFLAVR